MPQPTLLEQTTYVDFKRALAESNCQRCPLSQGRTHIVVDRGNPNTDTIIIGEAPGENEDREGRAFVGRGGRLLDSVMAQAAIDTNTETLIINIAKCRPPDNRRPEQEEADACRPYLKRQLELVKPRFILLLGATALKHIAPSREKASLTSQVGQMFRLDEYPGVEFMILYHPAYILRDRRKEPLMLEHLKYFKAHRDKVRKF